MPPFTSVYFLLHGQQWPHRSVAIGGLFHPCLLYSLLETLRGRKIGREGREVLVCVCMCVCVCLHCLFLVIFGNLCLSRNWPILSILMHLQAQSYLQCSLFFNICSISSDVSSFISDVDNLCLLLFLVSLTRALSILLIFKKKNKQLLILLIFSFSIFNFINLLL